MQIHSVFIMTVIYLALSRKYIKPQSGD